jgi:hypothetical protein
MEWLSAALLAVITGAVARDPLACHLGDVPPGRRLVMRVAVVNDSDGELVVRRVSAACTQNCEWRLAPHERRELDGISMNAVGFRGPISKAALFTFTGNGLGRATIETVGCEAK